MIFTEVSKIFVDDIEICKIVYQENEQGQALYTAIIKIFLRVIGIVHTEFINLKYNELMISGLKTATK